MQARVKVVLVDKATQVTQFSSARIGDLEPSSGLTAYRMKGGGQVMCLSGSTHVIDRTIPIETGFWNVDLTKERCSKNEPIKIYSICCIKLYLFCSEMLCT